VSSYFCIFFALTAESFSSYPGEWAVAGAETPPRMLLAARLFLLYVGLNEPLADPIRQFASFAPARS
jgi:hypothetical protein